MTLPTRWYRYHDTGRSIAGPSAVLTLDVGGSHISSAICQFPAFDVHRANRTELPTRFSAADFVNLLACPGSEESADYYHVVGAVVAIGGPFDYAHGISRMRHKFGSLYGFDLKTALAERLACSPHQVMFLNDGDAFLLGEIAGGYARGAHKAVGITLGTGIGSAFAVDGEVVFEGAGVPLNGEIWSLPYDAGMVEDVLSTRAIQQPFLQRTGHLREVVEIASLARRECVAAEIFSHFGEHLGQILRRILADFAPEVVVLEVVSPTPLIFSCLQQRSSCRVQEFACRYRAYWIMLHW
jgi:glucokinase